MESRRDFFKKAGLAGGLGAAGALTLRREYVKPVVRLLEPGAAYAQTPAISVVSAVWSRSPVDLNLYPAIATVAITLDVPGASAPAVGSTFNASVTVTNTGGTWGSGIGLPVGNSITSSVIDNVGVAGPGGLVAFAVNVTVWTVNGGAILPGGLGSVPAAMLAFLLAGPSGGDSMTVTLNVDADPGVTTGGNSYPAQTVGSFGVLFFV